MKSIRREKLIKHKSIREENKRLEEENKRLLDEFKWFDHRKNKNTYKYL